MKGFFTLSAPHTENKGYSQRKRGDGGAEWEILKSSKFDILKY